MTAAGHVFISHGSENRDTAEELAAFLEARGVRIWIAPRDVRPGMDYSEQLQQAIEHCIAFVVLVTEKANKSPYVRAETEMAFSTEKPIFPVRMSDIAPASGLALFLKIRHWTDAFGRDRDANLDRLARELQTLSGISPDRGQTAPPLAPPPTSPPPAPPAPPPPAPPTADEERKLRAAIGPNAEYYLGRWRKMDAGNSKISWNWPAFLFNLFWFAYRKMWLPMIGVVAATILIGVLTVGAAPAVQLLAMIAIGVAAGLLANFLYRKQTARLVDDSSALPPQVAEERLRSLGGVSVPALIATIATVLVLVSVAIAIAAQQMRPPAPSPSPAGPDANATEGDKPAGPADEPRAAEAAAFDRNDLVGRWADVGDCANASEFTSDGRFLAPDGGVGNWMLQGDRLTISGSGGSITVQLTRLDRAGMTAISPDGTAGTSQRC